MEYAQEQPGEVKSGTARRWAGALVAIGALALAAAAVTTASDGALAGGSSNDSRAVVKIPTLVRDNEIERELNAIVVALDDDTEERKLGGGRKSGGNSCPYQCPPNSYPTNNKKRLLGHSSSGGGSCPSSFEDCECNKRSERDEENGRCIDTCKDRYNCPANSRRRQDWDGCYDSFESCECRDNYKAVGRSCVLDCSASWFYTCPPRSKSKLGNKKCPTKFKHCKCNPGWRADKRLERCEPLCKNDYVCPENSYPHPKRTCINDFGDCLCDPYHKHEDAWQMCKYKCSHRCPKNSEPKHRTKCPKSDDDCKCKKGYFEPPYGRSGGHGGGGGLTCVKACYPCPKHYKPKDGVCADSRKDCVPDCDDSRRLLGGGDHYDPCPPKCNECPNNSVKTEDCADEDDLPSTCACENTFEWNEQGTACVCPDGYSERLNGKCKCDTPNFCQNRFNGVPKDEVDCPRKKDDCECGPGHEWDEAKTACVEENQGCECPARTTRKDGEPCFPAVPVDKFCHCSGRWSGDRCECPSGRWLGPNSDKCECTDGHAWNSEKGECQCKEPDYCTSRGGENTSPCAYNFNLHCKCPAGETYKDGKCQPNCGQCPDGMKPKYGVQCVTLDEHCECEKKYSCPHDAVAKDGVKCPQNANDCMCPSDPGWATSKPCCKEGTVFNIFMKKCCKRGRFC